MIGVLLLALLTASVSSDHDVAKMTCDIIRETRHTEEFMWDLPKLENDPVIVGFSVYAKSEVYLALSSKDGPNLDDATVYYIVIGGYDNTASFISECRGCEPLSTPSSERLQCDRINHYWLHFEDGYIKLGLRGKVEPITMYKVPQADFDPRYLGYSSNMLSHGMFTFSHDKFGYHIYSERVYWTSDAFCLNWFLNEIPTGSQAFCFQAKVEQGPIYVVFSPQRFRNPGETAYEIVIGAEDNSMTRIHTKLRGDHPIKEVSTPSILNSNCLVEYCFTFKTLEITFGTASNRNLVVWERDQSIQIKHIGFAGSKQPAQFLFPVEFIPLYNQGVINLPPEKPAGSDKCLEKPCGEYGDCAIDHSLNHGFKCNCANGYTGTRCNVPPPEVVVTTTLPCSPNPCLNGGFCVTAASTGSYSCDCAAGYKGTNCQIPPPEVVVTTTLPCSPNPCLNGGFCLTAASTGSYSCDCAAGYKGTNCQNDDPCSENKCENGAKCLEDRQSTRDYRCLCSGDFFGTFCEFKAEDAVVITTKPLRRRTTTPPPDKDTFTIDCNVELEENYQYVASADSQIKQVQFSSPRARDIFGENVDVDVECDPPSSSEFSIGTSTVTCTAYDKAGNSASCNFTVEVKNSCLNNPCGEYGTCVVESSKPSTFNCVCKDDYKGDLCQNAPQVDDEEEFGQEEEEFGQEGGEEEVEVFETTGESKQVFKKTIDQRKLSVFDISPFDDTISKEFTIQCKPGDFRLDVNSEAFILKDDNGLKVRSKETPLTSGHLKFSVEVTESSFIIYNMLNLSYPVLIEYSPPKKDAEKDLRCMAFEVKNEGNRKQKGCRVKYSTITQQTWHSRKRQVSKGDTQVIRQRSKEDRIKKRKRQVLKQSRTITKGGYRRS